MVLASRQKEYLQLKCPPLLLTFFELLDSLSLKKPNQEKYNATSKNFEFSLDFAQKQVEASLKTLPLRPALDICLGELRKKMIEMTLRRPY